MATPPATAPLLLVDTFDGPANTPVTAMNDGSPYLGQSSAQFRYDGEGHAKIGDYSKNGSGTLAWKILPSATEAEMALDIIPADYGGNLPGDPDYSRRQDYTFYVQAMLFAPDDDYDTKSLELSLTLYGVSGYYVQDQQGVYDAYAVRGNLQCTAGVDPQYDNGVNDGEGAGSFQTIPAHYDASTPPTTFGHCDLTAQLTTLTLTVDTVARTLTFALVDAATRMTTYVTGTMNIPTTMTLVPAQYEYIE